MTLITNVSDIQKTNNTINCWNQNTIEQLRSDSPGCGEINTLLMGMDDNEVITRYPVTAQKRPGTVA